jgi:hypothetical protein
MLKFLQLIFNRTSQQKTGINNNAPSWVGQPDTPATKQTDMDDIKDADDAVTAAKVALQQARSAARVLAALKKTKVEETDNRVMGIHAADKTKWAEYGTPVPVEPQARPVPAQAVIESVTDDDDGEGFIVTTKKDPNGDFLEIEVGSAPASTLALAPPFSDLRTTKKVKYTDNETVVGTRYFYRARWVNNAGKGPWSEVASSGVQ